jgi:hypothetical protein
LRRADVEAEATGASFDIGRTNVNGSYAEFTPSDLTANFTEHSGIPAINAGWLERQSKSSGRAMLNAELSIVDEVEAAINAGSAEKRLKNQARY